MTSRNFCNMFDILCILILTLVIDIKFGDPPNKFHPTAWIGVIISKVVNIVITYNRHEKFLGVVLTIFIVILILSILYILTSFIITILENYTLDYVFYIFWIISISVLLKTTISIRGMEKHAILIMNALDNNNYLDARQKLSLIVSRNTIKLDKNHIISGVLESVSENTVDGITAPLFYFMFFGIKAAFVYRTINTIDSMIGYKNTAFKNLGWFGANCDTLLNYIPSRLTAYVIIFCAMILGYDWRSSFKIMKRDNMKTESYNSGYPIAALAGALQVQLEKIDHYIIGDGSINLTTKTIKSAIRIMKLTSIVFCSILVTCSFLLSNYMGWMFFYV